MNGNFEKSGTYPFTTSPAEGYSVPREERSGDYIIADIRTQSFFVQLEDGAHKFVGERSEATRFPDAVEATRAAGKLVTELLKAA